MADNTQLDAGTGGDLISTDDLGGGVKVQRVKTQYGPDGSATDVSLTTPLPAQRPNVQGTGSPLGALNAAVTLACEGSDGVTWEIDTGTLVGTVSFEATLDDTNWFAIDSMLLDDSVVASVNSFPNRGELVQRGFSQVRMRVSAYTSGSSAARMEGTMASGVVRLGMPLPAGTNNIGDVDIASLPNEGQQTMANSISVAVASDQSVLSVDDNASSLTVDAPVGTPVNVQVGDGTDTLAISAGGAALVDGSATTQPVSGTVTAGNTAGDVAHDGVDSGNPVKIGAHATAGLRAAVGADDRADLSCDLAGQLRVTNETSDPLIVTDDGTAILVDGSAVTQPVSGTVTASNAAGDTAHDSPDSGNPVKIGAVAESTEIAAVADGDRTNVLATLNGKLVVHPFAVPERYTSGVTAAITGTTDTSVIAAPGAGLRLYITHVMVTNSHATVSTVVEIKDGTTVLYRGFAKADGGGFSCTLPVPLRLTANTALNAANVTTGSNTYVSASGYIAP